MPAFGALIWWGALCWCAAHCGCWVWHLGAEPVLVIVRGLDHPIRGGGVMSPLTFHLTPTFSMLQFDIFNEISNLMCGRPYGST